MTFASSRHGAGLRFLQPKGFTAMRDEHVIRSLFERLIDEDTDEHIHFVGDTFKNGMYRGKLGALKWVLGEAPSLAIQYDYQDWTSELKRAAEHLPKGFTAMRNENEIRDLLERLDVEDNDGQIRLEGDTFKNGMYAGKLLALQWVLGEIRSFDMGIQYEYEDWKRERVREAQDYMDKFNQKDPQP